MVTIHRKVQKKSRKPNKHPNGNRDTSRGHPEWADRLAPTIGSRFGWLADEAHHGIHARPGPVCCGVTG